MKRLQTALSAVLIFTATSASAAQWTAWINRDSPGGSGDWEWVANMYAEGRSPCADPIDIEVRRVSDQRPAAATGEVFEMSLAGFRCLKAEQPDNRCDDYEARLLCPGPTDGAWSPWINRDTPGGSGDYERADGNYPHNIDCATPVAIQTRRVSDGLDMIQTGEVYSFWAGNGFTCYNANQPDNTCDDYESRFFCPGEDYATPPADWELDMGDFVIVYDGDDLYDGNDGFYYVDTGFEIWFGTVYLSFDDAMLQLAEVDGALQLAGAVVSSLPTTNWSIFEVMDLMPGGLSFQLGYGSGDVLADLDAPLNPDYPFLFIEIVAGRAEFGNVTVEAPGAVSALIAIAPDPLTAYMNLGGFFPQVGIVTLDEVGIGFSTADGLLWQPDATWGFANEMVDQTGNLWIDGTVKLGLNHGLTLDLSGEVLGDVDFDAVANGDDGLETLAFNGGVSLAVGPSFLFIEQEIADMSVLYVAETQRWIASTESADLGPGMQGAAAWLDLDGSAKMAVAVQGDTLESLTIRGDLRLLDEFDLASATISADADSASFSGTLDLLTTDVSVNGSIDDDGFTLTGSVESLHLNGFYGVRVRPTLTESGMGVSLGLRAYDFANERYGNWVELSASYSHSDGWCADISTLEVCLGPNGEITLTGPLAEAIAAAIDEGWRVVSGTVRDEANQVVDDVGNAIQDILDYLANACLSHSDCASNQYCGVGQCTNKKGFMANCGSNAECSSGTCTVVWCT